MRIRQTIALCLFVLLSASHFKLHAQPDPEEALKKSAREMLQSMVQLSFTDSLNPRIIVLGNAECPHCEEFKALLKSRSVDYEDYEILKDRAFQILINNYMLEVDKVERLAYSFPVLVMGGKVYYNFSDSEKMAEEVRAFLEKARK